MGRFNRQEGGEPYPDRIIAAESAERDTGALDTLIAAYYPQILNYCRWHTADEQQAQDAAQETFLKAVRWLDSVVDFRGHSVPFCTKSQKTFASI